MSVEAVVKILQKNAETARAILRAAVRLIPEERTCFCARALRDAVITPHQAIPGQVKRDLAPIVGKYLGG